MQGHELKEVWIVVEDTVVRCIHCTSITVCIIFSEILIVSRCKTDACAFGFSVDALSVHNGQCIYQPC